MEISLLKRLPRPFTTQQKLLLALWSSPPPAWADSSLEEGVPVNILGETISKRGVCWAQLASVEGTVLLVPLAGPTNLRIGGEPGELVMSDFLSAGDFLGKFDSGEPGFLGNPPVLKHLNSGEEFKGGFTIYFLSSEQARAFRGLQFQDRDLTWRRHPKQGARLN